MYFHVTIIAPGIKSRDQWKREIDSKVSLPNGKPLPVLLLANKSDLDGVEINRTELDGFCKEHGFVGW